MKNAGFIKRILVMIYDGLLLAGVVMVAYAPLFGLLQLAPEGFTNSTLGTALRSFYLLTVSFLFYGWFWTHGGQTLGMKAWRLYLIKPNGKFPNWPNSLLRFVIALCSWGLVAGLLWAAGIKFWYLAIGLGYTWILLNPAKLAWHDIFSNTRIVQLAKDPSNNPANHNEAE